MFAGKPIVRLSVLGRGYDLRDSQTDLKLPKAKLTNFEKYEALNMLHQLCRTTFQSIRKTPNIGLTTVKLVAPNKSYSSLYICI